MNLRRKSLIFCAMFMIGLAAAVLSVGSLVNFHQYKIWGKPLLVEMIGYKRDNEKATKSFQSYNNNSGSPSCLLVEGAFPPSGFVGGIQSLPCNGFLLNPGTDHPASSSFLYPFPALRAPPQG